MGHAEHPVRLAAFALVGAALIAAAWLLLGGQDDPPAWVHEAPSQEQEQLPTADAIRAGDAAADGSRRVEVAPAPLVPDGAAVLVVSGRVMDTNGQPVGGAEVRVLQRESIDFGEIFSRGGGRGGGRGGDAESWRERFQRVPLGESARTDEDGAFVLRGRSFETAEISVAARHRGLAPNVVTRTWQVAEGALQVGDIVLDQGVYVRGFVVDDGGQSVSGAEVSYSAERGGSGGRGFWTGSGSVVADLVQSTRTDSSGAFQLGPLPWDDFRLSADAAQHVGARTSRLEPDQSGQVPEQRITLTKALRLEGVVRDAAGIPGAGA